MHTQGMNKVHKVIKRVLRYEIEVFLKNSDFSYLYGSISYLFGYEKNRCFFLMVPDIVMKQCGNYLAQNNRLVQAFMLLKDVAAREAVDGRLADVVLVVHDETARPDPATQHARNWTAPTADGMHPSPLIFSLRCCVAGTVAGSGVCVCGRVCVCVTNRVPCTRACRAGHCRHCRPTWRRRLRVR